MYVYGAALWWPERLKAPSEQEVILHNLYWERPEGILTNKVVYARATSSGGVRRGENPGGNFSAERLSGEPVGSFLQLFKKFLPLFQFVQISYYGNNKKLSDHFTNWATKTLVNIALFLGNVNLKNFLNFWHYMLFVCKIVESSIAYCIDCFWDVSKVKYIFLGWWLDGWPIWVRIPRKIS